MTKKTEYSWTAWALALVILIIGVGPLATYFEVQLCAYVWDHLLARDYGDGPSISAWYGVSVFMTLLTMHLKRSKAGDDPVQLVVFPLLTVGVLWAVVPLSMWWMHVLLGWGT